MSDYYSTKLYASSNCYLNFNVSFCSHLVVFIANVYRVQRYSQGTGKVDCPSKWTRPRCSTLKLLEFARVY